MTQKTGGGIVRRWGSFRGICWTCAAVGWGLGLLLVATASASDMMARGAGPEWQDVALGGVGLISVLLGVIVTRLDRRQDEVAARVDKFAGEMGGMQVALAREHFTKSEVREGLSRIEASVSESRKEFREELESINRRLSQISMPSPQQRHRYAPRTDSHG